MKLLKDENGYITELNDPRALIIRHNNNRYVLIKEDNIDLIYVKNNGEYISLCTGGSGINICQAEIRENNILVCQDNIIIADNYELSILIVEKIIKCINNKTVVCTSAPTANNVKNNVKKILIKSQYIQDDNKKLLDAIKKKMKTKEEDLNSNKIVELNQDTSIQISETKLPKDWKHLVIIKNNAIKLLYRDYNRG